MDAAAQRRARAKAIQQNLLYAVDDEEACPPEWIDLKLEIDKAVPALESRLAGEVERFVREPDIRVALARRERAECELRACVREINEKIRRMNLITPVLTIQRATLDADALLRPLFRTRRAPL